MYEEIADCEVVHRLGWGNLSELYFYNKSKGLTLERTVIRKGVQLYERNEHNYDGIKTSIINWKEGVVDSMLIRLSDAWAGSRSATRILRTVLYLKYGKMAGKWNGMFISRQEMITGN